MSNLISGKSMHQVTALSRPLDFHYPSNVFAAAISGLGFIVGLLLGLFEDKESLEVVWLGVVTSMTVFTAWALARELDPDHSFSAGIASVLALAGMIIWRETTNFFAFYLMLVVLRGVVRTVGIPLTLVDMGLLVVGAGLIAVTNSWLLGVLTGAALVLDGHLSRPNQAAQFFGVLAAVVTFAVAALTQEFSWEWTGRGVVLAVLAGISAVYLFAVITAAAPVSVGDSTGQPLDAARLKTGRILALIGASGVYVWIGGDTGAWTLLALWSAFLAIGIYGIFLKMR